MSVIKIIQNEKLNPILDTNKFFVANGLISGHTVGFKYKGTQHTADLEVGFRGIDIPCTVFITPEVSEVKFD